VTIYLLALFRQYFDSQSNVIRFTSDVVRKKVSAGKYGAWASNFQRLGNFNDPNCKTGSIFSGVRMLETLLHEADPNYRTLVFRAGEYDFGTRPQEQRESILALRRNKILADSDAHRGNVFGRGFKFFRPVGKNVYFCSQDNINEPADSLLDIGILEMVPVPKMNAHDYIRPVDEWTHLKKQYELCFDGDKIKNDVFILMEMYHINNVNADYVWDELDENYEDWGRMKRHFSGIKGYCPRVESVRISEAVRIYLDHYTPDVIALRNNERKFSNTEFEYDIDILGADIEVSTLRPHYVSVKPPIYFLGNIETIELFHNGVSEKVWKDVTTYNDLEFTIEEKRGYVLKVTLKQSLT